MNLRRRKMRNIVKVELNKNITENRKWIENTVKSKINSLNSTLNIFFNVEMKEIVVKIDISK